MKWKSTAEPVPGTYSINRITVDIREYLVTKKNSVPPFAWMRKCENIITITANSIVVDIESARWGKNSVPPFLWGGKKTYSYPQIVTHRFYTMPTRYPHSYGGERRRTRTPRSLHIVFILCQDSASTAPCSRLALSSQADLIPPDSTRTWAK